ncbi:signal peptidase complex subunit 3 [Trichomonascus vanleenenianus]|uniref:signal peptidase complex subunit SPC3 n=1 Tax=Trichomonascus vanleenenianus TaxID=2268995 RepID=UPI003ECB8EEE
MAFAVAVNIVSIFQLHLSGAYTSPATVDSLNARVTEKFTRRFGSVDGKAKDNCRVNFDLTTDLTSLFNWNTKQIFIYLTAEYPGKREDINNRVTFWDKIITMKEDAVLDLKKVRGAYSVYDIDRHFNHQNATIRLEWNVQPYVGLLSYGEALLDGQSWFVFPEGKAK